MTKKLLTLTATALALTFSACEKEKNTAQQTTPAPTPTVQQEIPQPNDSILKVQAKKLFDQWRQRQYTIGDALEEKYCKPEYISNHNIEMDLPIGIEPNASIDIADLNNDGKKDAIATYIPVQCDGGFALSNTAYFVVMTWKNNALSVDTKATNNLANENMSDIHSPSLGDEARTTFTSAKDGILHFEYGTEDTIGQLKMMPVSIPFEALEK